MRTVAVAALLLLAGLAPGQDERDKKVAGQKKAAEDAWKSLDAGESAFVETKHLLIFAPKKLEKGLKDRGELLEKYHEKALEATGTEAKDLPGKITVYLLPEDGWASFARRVEKRRPLSGEVASYKAEDGMLHAAVAPSGGKVPVEARAGEMVAAVILQRKAGRATALPDWLTAGFGRATSYQVSPKEKFVLADRAQAKALAKKRDASVVWDGTAEKDEAEALQGSVAELLAYGPAKKYFAKTLAGFQPGENQASKTTQQALEEGGLKAELLAKAWKNWLAK